MYFQLEALMKSPFSLLKITPVGTIVLTSSEPNNLMGMSVFHLSGGGICRARGSSSKESFSAGVPWDKEASGHLMNLNDQNLNRKSSVGLCVWSAAIMSPFWGSNPLKHRSLSRTLTEELCVYICMHVEYRRLDLIKKWLKCGISMLLGGFSQ